MEHSNCSDLLKSIGDYLDGDLQPELCIQLEEHIRGCEKCRIVVDTVRKTISLYHEDAVHESMPEELKAHLFRELDLQDYISGGSQE